MEKKNKMQPDLGQYTFSEMVKDYQSEMHDKSDEFLEKYISSVDERFFNKWINLIFGTPNGAKYEAAVRILNERKEESRLENKFLKDKQHK